MLKYCLDKWNKNKDILENRLRTCGCLADCDYEYLLRTTVDCIFNDGDPVWSWDTENISEIDNGHYQGTLLYLIPAKTYQPSEYEYLMTYIGYGSCSGCDVLQSIQPYDDECSTAEVITDFMSLCKDFVTNTIKPYNSGWRNEEIFEHVTMEVTK